MVVSYAKCCYPIPGDDVMGYLSSGRGVVIHRNCCGNLSNFRKNAEKWIACSWEENIDREFSSQIQVDTFNKPGVLAEVAATIGDSGFQHRAGRKYWADTKTVPSCRSSCRSRIASTSPA